MKDPAMLLRSQHASKRSITKLKLVCSLLVNMQKMSTCRMCTNMEKGLKSMHDPDGQINDDDCSPVHNSSPQTPDGSSIKDRRRAWLSGWEEDEQKTPDGSNGNSQHELVSTLRPLSRSDIDDALNSALVPLISVLQTKEENEQKHRAVLLALEQKRLTLKQQRMRGLVGRSRFRWSQSTTRISFANSSPGRNRQRRRLSISRKQSPKV